jgi:hypothetical protein
MRSVIATAVIVMTTVMMGCSSAPRTPPVAPDPPDLQNPIAPVPPPDPSPIGIGSLDGNEDVPRSIRRLVSEQRDEVQSIRLLAGDLHDRRGRARALQEAQDLAAELSEIESAVVSAGTDSERLDDIVRRLHLLETKTGLIHDALRQASL